MTKPFQAAFKIANQRLRTSLFKISLVGLISLTHFKKAGRRFRMLFFTILLAGLLILAPSIA